MQMDGGSSHWTPADCVHAACKCMEHEAGPNLSQPGTAKLNTLQYAKGWISVDGSLGQEVYAKNYSNQILRGSHTFSSIEIHT